MQKGKHDGESENFVDDAETFLTLDWPEEGTDINLEDENRKGGQGRSMDPPTALSTPRTAMRRRRAMLGLAPPPTMLMKSTPAPLYQMLHQKNARQKGFRLSICSIDTSTGALLMDANATAFHSGALEQQHCRTVGKSPSNYVGGSDEVYSNVDNDDDDDFGADHEMGSPLRESTTGLGEDHYDSEDEDEADWWAPLDPHDASGSRARPFRKGSTTKSRRLERRKAVSSDTPAPSTFSFGKQKWEWSVGSNGMCRIVTSSLSGGYDEFGDVRKRFRSMRRKWKEQQKTLMRQRRVLDDHDDDDDDDDGAFFDAGENIGDDDLEANGPDADAWTDLVDEEHEMEEAPPMLSSPSYENLVRAHISEWFRGAEKYERTTQLSRRVTEWTKRLEPILAAEELHPPFNIRSIGGEIIEAVGNENGGDVDTKSKDASVPFESIVRGKVEYEICRSFLAMLQLANDGNIEIIPHDKDDAGTKKDDEVEFRETGNISVVLKSTKMSDIRDYRAPSVTTTASSK